METTPATPGTTPTVPPPGPGDGTPTVDEARALTDEAAGDIDSGDYDAAIDKSERALTALEGTGDPYEANALYIVQSRLAARLRKRDDDANELVIWDVGLGAASNAMAETCSRVVRMRSAAGVPFWLSHSRGLT